MGSPHHEKETRQKKKRGGGGGRVYNWGCAVRCAVY